MEDILFYLGIASAILAGGFLVTAIILFFKFKIPVLWKEVNGTLEREQIEEIRSKNSNATQQKNKVNVFEELEKHAKVKKNNTHSLNVGTTNSLRLEKSIGQEEATSILDNANPEGEATTVLDNASLGSDATTLLENANQSSDIDFVIEKNVVYVSTSEVIL